MGFVGVVFFWSACFQFRSFNQDKSFVDYKGPGTDHFV